MWLHCIQDDNVRVNMWLINNFYSRVSYVIPILCILENRNQIISPHYASQNTIHATFLASLPSPELR